MNQPNDRTRGVRRLRTALALLVLGAAATACLDDAEPYIVEPAGGTLFDRYVSLGNSITAGFQSGGIHIGFQQEAYPVLLANKADAPFGIPALNRPGCPPPYVAPLSTERTDTVACGLRSLLPPPIVQNLAVPGAAVADLTDPLGTGTTLNTLILGGRTQVGAMVDDQPTLVSVWIGNNDALGAALSGDTLALTPLAAFEASYDKIVEGIKQTPAQDAILIGVADAAVVAPALQPGAFFWAVAQSPTPPVPLQVSNNCAPFTGGGAPNPTAFSRLVSLQIVPYQLSQNPTGPVVIDCSEDAPFVLNEAERQAVGARIAAFNAYIQQQAEANDWIYVDANTSLIGPALNDPDKIRKCQGFYDGSVTDAASFMAAVVNTCPSPDAPNFFGSYFSYDGVHPTAEAHATIADTLAGRLNTKHGLSLPMGQ